MRRRRHPAVPLAAVLLVLAACLGLGELGLRLLAAGSGPLATHLKTYGGRLYENAGWEAAFLTSLKDEDGELTAGGRGLCRTEPERGWTPKPNLSLRSGDVTTSTNAQGGRGTGDFAPDPDRFTILVLGDSMTFGDEADDAVIWTKKLQEAEPRFNVINLAVPGYGIDQMLITLEAEIARYRPDLVVMAFISEDLYRALLDFFVYRKPRFDRTPDGLVLRNIPVPPLAQVVGELRARPPEPWSLDRLALVRTVKGAYFYNGPLLGLIPERERLFSLAEALFARAEATARDHGAAFLAVNLPFGREHAYPSSASAGDRLVRELAVRKGMNTLSLRDRFTAVPGLVRGHYQAREHAMAAEAILEGIRRLDRWRTWQRR